MITPELTRLQSQEDKDLLLKDLCARVPYGVKLQNVNNIESIVKLRSIDLDNYCCEILFYTYQGKALTICDKSNLFRFGKILRYKPYLFPLSSITEEQWNNAPSVNLTNFTFESFKCGCFTLASYTCENNLYDLVKFINWLIENHFDIYGLIPKNLAIDATGLNIY